MTKATMVLSQPALINGGGKAQKDKKKLRDLIINELSQPMGGRSTIKLIGLNITSIPEADVELLRNVERLSLRKNFLINLPPNFCTLKGLRYLDLDSNILREIPPVLLQCPKLEILDLSYNSIESLPQEISTLWSQKLKVLSLKNNNVASIWDLMSIVKFDSLSVLEIEGNPIPSDELDSVRAYTPITSNMVKEEYWAIALRRYLLDHSSTPNVSQDLKISKAAKRMGFINTTSPVGGEHTGSITSSSVPAAGPTYISETDLVSHNESANGANDLYNHSKFNDYFKRLSVLPEESPHSEQHRVSHDELLVSCRKLLFSFTECQQNVRKIASFCKEKAVAVNVVSLLYSVRSHIDNLVEVLEQAENEEKSQDGALIKLCITIIAIFKQIISQLRKNFNTFFEADDLCFIRMFYMTLVCSYTEIYNAWCYIDAEDAKLSRKRQLSRSHSLMNRVPSGNNVSSVTGPATIYLPRTRSNASQTRAAPITLNTGAAVASSIDGAHNTNTVQHVNNIISPSLGNSSPPHPLNSQMSTHSTPPPSGSIMSTVSQFSVEHSPRQYHAHSPRLYKTESHSATNREGGTDSDSGSPSVSMTMGTNVDLQLYQTLSTVVIMVNVVYDQLTSEISKAAMASTKGQQELTDSLLSKIRDLTETCCQAMELSKSLNDRLHVLTSDAETSEKYLTNSEKVKTWENINAFLKSIISILANTKVVMADMPALNEIRPNLASLAKITKDVTVILDLSSYKGVSVIAAQNQPQQQVQAQSLSQSQHHQHQSNNIPEEKEGHPYTPKITPQPTPSHSQVSNPFDQLKL